MTRPELSLVVPLMNESANMEELMQRSMAAITSITSIATQPDRLAAQSRWTTSTARRDRAAPPAT